MPSMARPPPPPNAHFSAFGAPGGEARPAAGVRVVPDERPGREKGKKETKKKVAAWVLGKPSKPKKSVLHLPFRPRYM